MKLSNCTDSQVFHELQLSRLESVSKSSLPFTDWRCTAFYLPVLYILKTAAIETGLSTVIAMCLRHWLDSKVCAPWQHYQQGVCLMSYPSSTNAKEYWHKSKTKWVHQYELFRVGFFFFWCKITLHLYPVFTTVLESCSGLAAGAALLKFGY